MADLIDRQALLEWFKNWSDYDEFSVRYITGIIEDEPSAVRHGVWMEENRRPRSAMFYCSECHRTAYDIQPTRDKTWEKRCRYAYCPNCGARMDGE